MIKKFRPIGTFVYARGSSSCAPTAEPMDHAPSHHARRSARTLRFVFIAHVAAAAKADVFSVKPRRRASVSRTQSPRLPTSVRRGPLGHGGLAPMGEQR